MAPSTDGTRLSDCAQLHSVGLRRRALEADFVNLWVGASRQLGEKRDLPRAVLFRHQPPNDMTGITSPVTAAPSRPTAPAPASNKAASLKLVMTDHFGDYRQGVRGDTSR